jgi:hypothetical protein
MEGDEKEEHSIPGTSGKIVEMRHCRISKPGGLVLTSYFNVQNLGVISRLSWITQLLFLLLWKRIKLKSLKMYDSGK